MRYRLPFRAAGSREPESETCDVGAGQLSRAATAGLIYSLQVIKREVALLRGKRVRARVKPIGKESRYLCGSGDRISRMIY